MARKVTPKREDDGEVFAFETPLLRSPGYYGIVIPADVSRAIDRRGPVPVIATIDGAVEVRASLVPGGGGRHRLQLNARVREEARVQPGQRLHIVLRVDEAPRAEPTPADLERALRRENLLDTFVQFPVGKRSHIIHWIDEAVSEETRDRRIAKTLEVTRKRRMRVGAKRGR